MDWIVTLVGSLAWPAAVVFLALCFREEVRRLIPRVRKALGFEFEPALAQDVASTQNTPGYKGYANPVFRDSIDKLIPNVRIALGTSAETTPADVIRALAESELALKFERIYRVIFGSQVGAMRTMLHKPQPTVEVRKIYEASESSKLDPSLGMTYENWAAFPINVGLIRSNGLEYHLTADGRAFLEYLAVSKLPEKPF